MVLGLSYGMTQQAMQGTVALVSSTWRRYSLGAKLKISIGFYMIASKVRPRRHGRRRRRPLFDPLPFPLPHPCPYPLLTLTLTLTLTPTPTPTPALTLPLPLP
jgi:hypothetical protein